VVVHKYEIMVHLDLDVVTSRVDSASAHSEKSKMAWYRLQ